MVQQQFFAKDLSFPVNKGRVLMGTSGNISKSFRVVGALGEGKCIGVWRGEKMGLSPPATAIWQGNLPATAGGGRGWVQKNLKETNSGTGIFL